jgi:uncharacterized membrane protein YphA (DoxX/SURF4 family)
MSIRGTAGYHLQGQNAGFNAGPSRSDATNDPSPLDAIREQTSKIEDWLDSLSEPVKPYLPAIGRFLIVVTFLEDALRILTQWTDQLVYLHDYRHSKSFLFGLFVLWGVRAWRERLGEYKRRTIHSSICCQKRLGHTTVDQLLTPHPVPSGITHLFLIVNVVAMFASSLMIIIRKHSEYAVIGLIGVVVTQALGYGLIFDLNFFLRNLSVMGGLLMVLSDSWVRKKFAPAGLPQLDEKDRKMYFQLAGRVLLIFLFIGFVFAGEWSIGRVAVILVGLVACVMVVVGFKAKWSAIILVTILSVFNVFVNNFWTVSG